MRSDSNDTGCWKLEITSAACPGWHWLGVRCSALAGCEEEPRQTVGKPAAPRDPKEDSGPIIGQRTQKIVNAAPALKKGDAKIASTKIVAKDPITLQGNAYVSIIGRSFAALDSACARTCSTARTTDIPKTMTNS